MDYESLMEYLWVNDITISCPTWEDRKILIDKLKEMNPDADVVYIGQEYDSLNWPLALPLREDHQWALTRMHGNTTINIAEFLKLCGDSPDIYDISINLDEVI